MPIINFTNPIAVLIALILFLLILYLARETKKSVIMGILLFAFIAILLGHAIEFGTIVINNLSLGKVLAISSMIDFIFILLSFLSYLWIDELEVEIGKRKSIDDGLAWFWKKV